jgi:tetratricopeptide (TPR) repeat protein
VKTPHLGLWFLVAVAATSLAADPSPTVKFRFDPAPEVDEPGKKKVDVDVQHAFTAGNIAIGRGDLNAAREDFLKVLQAVPDSIPAMVNLGLVEYRAKNLEKAEGLLQNAVNISPKSGLGWLLLGVVQYDRNRFDFALASLAQAAVLDPKNPMVHQYLGVTIGQKGWYSGAEDELRKAIELDPEYAEAHFNLAVFYLQRNPPAVELARRHYERALELGAAPDSDVERSLGDKSKP